MIFILRLIVMAYICLLCRPQRSCLNSYHKPETLMLLSIEFSVCPVGNHMRLLSWKSVAEIFQNQPVRWRGPARKALEYISVRL
jgi:hypothetical protein